MDQASPDRGAQVARVSVRTLREAALLAEPALHEPGWRGFADRVHEDLTYLVAVAEKADRERAEDAA